MRVLGLFVRSFLFLVPSFIFTLFMVISSCTDRDPTLVLCVYVFCNVKNTKARQKSKEQKREREKKIKKLFSRCCHR